MTKKTSRLAKTFAAAFAAGAINLTLSVAAGAQGIVTSSAYGCELDAAIAQGTATPAQFIDAVARLPRDPYNPYTVLLDNGVRANARQILAIAAAGNGVPARSVTSAPDRSNPANFVAHLQFTNQPRALSHSDFMYAVFSGVSTGLFGTVDLCAPPPPPPPPYPLATPVIFDSRFPVFLAPGPASGTPSPQPAPVSATPGGLSTAPLQSVSPGPGSTCELDTAIAQGTPTPDQLARAIAMLPRDPNNPGVVLLANGTRANVRDVETIANLPALFTRRDPSILNARDRSDPNNFQGNLFADHGSYYVPRTDLIKAIFRGVTRSSGGTIDLCPPAPSGPTTPSDQLQATIVNSVLLGPVVGTWPPQPAPSALASPVMVAPSITPPPTFNPVLGAALGPVVGTLSCELDRAILWGRASQPQLMQAIARLPRDPNDPSIALLANGARARISEISALLRGGVGLDASPLSTPPDRSDPNTLMEWLVHDNGGRALSHADMVSAIFRGVTNTTGGSVDLCAPAPPQPTFIVSVGITLPNQTVPPITPGSITNPPTLQVQSTPAPTTTSGLALITPGQDGIIPGTSPTGPGCELDTAIVRGTATSDQLARAVNMLPRAPNNPDVVVIANGTHVRITDILTLVAEGNGVSGIHYGSQWERTAPDHFFHFLNKDNPNGLSHSELITAIFRGVSRSLGGTVDLCPPTSPSQTTAPLAPVNISDTSTLQIQSTPSTTTTSVSPLLIAPSSSPRIPTPRCELNSALLQGTATQTQLADAVARLPRDPSNPEIVLLHNGWRARASDILAHAATGNGIPAAAITSEPDRTNPDNFLSHMQYQMGGPAFGHDTFVRFVFFGMSNVTGGPVDFCAPLPVTPQNPSSIPLAPVNQLPVTPQIQTTLNPGPSVGTVTAGTDMCPLRNIETGLGSAADFARAVAMLPRDPNNPDVVLLADGVRARASQLVALNQSGGIPHGNVASEPDRTNPDNFVAYHQYAYGGASGRDFIISVFWGLTTGWGGPVNLCAPAPTPLLPTSPVLQIPTSPSIQPPTTGVLVALSGSALPPSSRGRRSAPCELSGVLARGIATPAQFAEGVARLPRDPNNPDIVILHNGLRARASEILAIAATGNGLPDAAPVTSEPDRTNPDNFVAYLRFFFGMRGMAHSSFTSSVFYGLAGPGGSASLCSPAVPSTTAPVIESPQPLSTQTPSIQTPVRVDPGQGPVSPTSSSTQQLSHMCRLESAITLGTATQAQIVQAIARLPRSPNDPGVALLYNGVRAHVSEILAIAASGNGVPAGPIPAVEPDRTNPDNFVNYLRYNQNQRTGRNGASHAEFVAGIFFGVAKSLFGTVDLCGPPVTTTPLPSPTDLQPVDYPVILNTDGPGTFRVVLTGSPQSPPLPTGVIHLSDPVSVCWTFDTRAGLWVQPPSALTDPSCARLVTLNPNLNITDDGPTPSVLPDSETLTPSPTPTSASDDCWVLDESTGLWAENPQVNRETCVGRPAPTPLQSENRQPPLLTVEEAIEDIHSDSSEIVEQMVDEAIRETIEEVVEVCFFEEECEF